MKKRLMNEYRILYCSEKFDHAARVFILAGNVNEAQEKVMDTYNIPRQGIVHTSLWKQNVDVIVDGANTYKWEAA